MLTRYLGRAIDVHPYAFIAIVIGLVVGLAWIASGCDDDAPSATSAADLVVVAESPRQWTGVAVSAAGRLFVNFPRWSANVPISVAEIEADGNIRPYPDTEWNSWSTGTSPGDHFVCVQSVYVDADDDLWILDPASPYLQGVVEGGAKLMRVDLDADQVEQTIFFDAGIAPPQSYLNDVRVDTRNQRAYLTDSGLGALIVVDLTSGESRRVLAEHPSTRAEDIVLTVGGRELRQPDGSPFAVHSDGIALHPSGDYVYFQALTGRNLYRVATRWLSDASLGEEELGGRVEHVVEGGACDGIIFDAGGRLYLSALEEDAVKRLLPSGSVETVVSSPLLAWPDSFAIGPDGSLYVTTSQIHLGQNPGSPYRVWKVVHP
jgi:sugar lactone lactonase YvrE